MWRGSLWHNDSQKRTGWCPVLGSVRWTSCFLEPSSWERTDASAAGVNLLLPGLSGRTWGMWHSHSLRSAHIQTHKRIHLSRKFTLGYLFTPLCKHIKCFILPNSRSLFFISNFSGAASPNNYPKNYLDFWKTAHLAPCLQPPINRVYRVLASF